MDGHADDVAKVLGLDRPRHRRGRRVAVILLVVLAGLGLALALIPGRTDRAARYTTEAVTRGDLVVTVTATGTVEPITLVEVSSELSGTVRAVLVDVDEAVTVGQELARLDTTKLEAALAHSRATLEARRARVEEARASVRETREQYERIAALAGRGIASTQTLEAAAAARDRAMAAELVAHADVAVAEASLRIDETNLAKACICAPIDGVVLERNVDPGQIVAASLQAPVLFTIAQDLTRMELRVDVDEADIGAVKVGDRATFAVEAHRDRAFPATIEAVHFLPKTVDGVVTYEAILRVDNEAMLLRPGMTATAEIVVEEISDALLVPNAALRFAPPVEAEQARRGGGLLGLIVPRPPGQPPIISPPLPADGRRTVWVLRDGTPTAVTIRTGASDGLRTVVAEGDLRADDRVITDVAETK